MMCCLEHIRDYTGNHHDPPPAWAPHSACRTWSSTASSTELKSPRDMPDPLWKPISSRRSGVTVAAVSPLALASRRVGGQGRADDQAATGDGVEAEEVAIARPGSPASSEGYRECGGSPTPGRRRPGRLCGLPRRRRYPSRRLRGDHPVRRLRVGWAEV